MGNSRSQQCRPSRPLYLLYLINRTWNVVVEPRNAGKEDRFEDTDRETDLSSKCSGCRGCGYHQEISSLESEPEMAPNAEEELLTVKPWGPQPEKERLRPPTYNAEDYAVALRRWGRRPLCSPQDPQGTLPSTTSSSSGYASGSGEMTLRQFTSVSELLNKLRADLRLAFPSFVQEFASPPADGITLLLETLRGVQLAQSLPPSGQSGPKIGTRRAALDELGCVECLAACGERCPDAPRLLVEAQPGLLALAVCLTSSLNRSRVLALQLLTRVCHTPGGHAAVSEAVSTLRLKYGEGGRFRFLAGALLAPKAAIALRVAGVSFLNAFLRSAPRSQTRLYIQAEACEAGLEPKILQEWLTETDKNTEDPLTELLLKEVQKWAHNCVDVEALQKRAYRAEETCRSLSKKICALQNQVQKLQVENLNGYNCENGQKLGVRKQQKISSNAEDEGISSSERSCSPEDLKHERGLLKTSAVDNDQETTIDDVIEELRIIVKDAEEEYEDKNAQGPVNNSNNTASTESEAVTYLYDEYVEISSSYTKNHPKDSKAENCLQTPVTYFGPNDRASITESSATRKLSSNPSSISKSSVNGSLKILVKGMEEEEAIVPEILHPQPPRRGPPCLSTILAARNCTFEDHEGTYNSPGEEAEEETLGDGSDSLLSASRLKYSQGEHQTADGSVRKSNDNERVTSFRTDDILSKNKNEKSVQNPQEKERSDKKTIRNYEVTLPDARSCTKKNSKFTKDAVTKTSRNSVSHAEHKKKCKSELEKRKLLRRASSSQDVVSSTLSPKLKRTSSGVEGRIRKFESLSSFDNLSLHHFTRIGSMDNVTGQYCEEGSKMRMRRSESFHHVSLAKKEPSSRGGSDSGLFYVTDFDLEPLVTRRNSSEASRSTSLLTKSLDRIDEGLDSMVDIVVTEGRPWGQEKRLKNERSSRTSRCKTGGRTTENPGDVERMNRNGGFVRDDRPRSGKKVKEDELRNSSETRQLRNDELYNERPVQNQWSYKNELNNARQLGLGLENPLVILSKVGVRHDSFCYDKSGSKFSTRSTESGIYLPGRSYDAFGLGKSRFNAGKYSGEHLLRENSNSGRNPGVIPANKHGKVTDIISGLY